MTELEQSEKQPVQLDDNIIRWIAIPMFGVVIPNITGMLSSLSLTSFSYWFSYLYFITLSALIWQGNRYLMFRTRQRFTWFDKPIEKLVLLVFNNIFYTAPITIGMLCLWYAWMGFDKPDWTIIQIVALINIICVLFITHIYETVFMVKEQQTEQTRNAELMRAKAEAELIALRNQVDPHFMFNSLNTLTYLIENDPKRALLFTTNLAEVYRYILMQKDHNLVLLHDELDFTKKYAELLHLRFGDALRINDSFDISDGKQFLIPPTCVFMALENAVKHNEISEGFPLNIQMRLADNYLQIENSIKTKKHVPNSSRIGLKNLDERFRMLTGKGIITEKDGGLFRISMPVVQLN